MAKPLGPKSTLIREAINHNPALGNTELAQLINGSETAKREKIEVKPSDIAQQKQVMKKARGKTAPARASARAEPAATRKPTGNGRRKGARKRQGGARPHAAAPPPGDVVDDVAAVKKLVEKLGADQVRRIVGLFE